MNSHVACYLVLLNIRIITREMCGQTKRGRLKDVMNNSSNVLYSPLFQIVSQSNLLESQTILSLIKIIERITKFYDTEYIYCKNIFNKESNGTYLVS